jgi:aminomethyltransferase
LVDSPLIQKTPLYEEHLALKAKMVAFGDWKMPVSYEGVLLEHKTVREHVGIFDVSHMGEVRVKGADATRFLQWLTINDVHKLSDGGGQYSAILNPDGGMIDDLIIYRLHSDEYFICVNASNTKKDFDWIKTQSKNFSVDVVNESARWAQVAVQGPNSLALVQRLVPGIESLPYTNIRDVTLFGKKSYIARTGYTGEWGYEIYVPNESAKLLWLSLLETSGELGTKPIGLGARDTLRLESCYLLYGNDMNDQVSPLEAGIQWATKLDKGDFIGRSALIEQKQKGVSKKIVAFKMTEDGIPRHDMPIKKDGAVIGQVTSGSVLPTLGGAGGMAMVPTTLKEGDLFLVDIRGSLKPAIITKRPLYSAKVK